MYVFFSGNGLCEGERLNDKFIFQAKCVVSDSSAKVTLFLVFLLY